MQVVAVLLAALALAPPEGSGARAAIPVLVELFTSEGCSSCPPADAVLARLVQDQPVPGAEIVALGEHVDYWDDSGWKDSFSSPRFTERQELYVRRLRVASAYTPQLVVAGRYQVLGSDGSAARAAIATAARTPSGEVTLRVLPGPDSGGAVDVRASWPGGGDADVVLALVEDHATTRATGGENAGRTLEHAAVVRFLSTIGSARGAFASRVPIDRRRVSGAGRVVVFVEAPGGGPVLAVAAARLPPR
ncbi:MAG TPA: DUF1223 domain-containing protein [Anaeromyxobacteraceae bacterium]|nr:DUF1223 domain-containing protein [Anaeromyxobacteraceae bacterium]